MPAPGNEPVQRTTVTLPRRLARWLASEAERSGRSVSSIAREAVEEYAARSAPPPEPAFIGVASGPGDRVAEREDELLGGILEERLRDEKSGRGR